jgi:hypothetical protein
LTLAHIISEPVELIHIFAFRFLGQPSKKQLTHYVVSIL